MKLSNFVRTKIVANGPVDITHYAEVDVTNVTGVWKWRKETTQRVIIARKEPMGWFFVESGQYLPREEIDALERAFVARNSATVVMP